MTISLRWRLPASTPVFGAALVLACASGGTGGAATHEPNGADGVKTRAQVEPPGDGKSPAAPPGPEPHEERITLENPGHLDPRLVPSHPEGAIDVTPRTPNRCVAQLELTAELVGAEVTLRATLASNSDQPVRVTLRSPCPGGPVAFSGLEGEFDYYGTCNAGACRTAREPLTVFLPAERRKVEITSTSLPVSGDACRPRLAGGTHEIYGHAEVVSPEGATICGSAFTTFTVPEQEKKRARPATAPCPPQPICGLACPSGGFARDENGCSLCACAETFPGGF